MKNKKTFVGIALLIVVLVLGIAYATTIIPLTINGTASASFSEGNHKVAFTGKTSTEGTKGTVVASATDKEATLEISDLTTAGEVATVTFEVENSSTELESAIALTHAKLTGDDASYFTIETIIPEDGKVLSPEEKTNVRVNVTLVKTPVEEVSATIDVDLTATAQIAGN